MLHGGESKGFDPSILASVGEFRRKNRGIDENKLADEIDLSIAEDTRNPFHGMEGSDGYVQTMEAEPAGEDEEGPTINMEAPPENENGSEADDADEAA